MTNVKEDIVPSSYSQKRNQQPFSYQKRRGGRSKKPEEHKLSVQLGARVSMQTFDWLLNIAAYEGEGYTEIHSDNVSGNLQCWKGWEGNLVGRYHPTF